MANHQRIYTFDLLRGFAVFTMVLAHSVYFFHNRGNDFLLSVEGFGNTVSFVIFLLVSGAVAAVAYGPHRHHDRPTRSRVLTRVLVLLLAYYILALSLLVGDLIRAEGFTRLRLIYEVLSFRLMPGFTEYFPPFIFFSALLALLPQFFTFVSRRLITVIVVSVVSFLSGMALYYAPVDPTFRPWVALLAGAEGMYRFPLLQYLPVFLLGLYWGQQTLASTGLAAKRQLARRLGEFFLFLALGAVLWSIYFGPSLATVFLRWPPSIPFLSLGLAVAFGGATLLYAVRQLRQVRLLRDLLLMFGQNALGLFWSHVFLLGLYATAHGPKVSSVAIVLFLWLLLLLLSVALTTFLPFNFRLALTSARGSHEEYEEELGKEAVVKFSQDVATDVMAATGGLSGLFAPDRPTRGRRMRTRHRLGISLVVLAAAVSVFPSTIEELALQQQQRHATQWWNDTFAYRQVLTLHTSDAFTTLKPGMAVTMKFNHKELVDEGKSAADGRDVKLVYWTGREHLVAESTVIKPDSDAATLTFFAPVEIQAGKEENFYYLYYGGFVDRAPPDITTTPAGTVVGALSNEEVYPTIAQVSTTWSLIGEADTETVAFHIMMPGSAKPTAVTYEVLATDLIGPMTAGVDGSWEALVPVTALEPGTYHIQATWQEENQVRRSQRTGFYRSYPLYVAWTQDWEGYDVSQTHLDAIDRVATDFELPITHFFNPRIYVTPTISPQRAKVLTNWVQSRFAQGDAYGLHLHMFTDFVEGAGVKPKLEPNWGDNGSGYGVPLTAYDKNEQRQLIQYAVNLMVANGFGRPNLFRAGGWYANLDTLTALEELGFTVDSSARTGYKFGKNQLPGYWNILPTARPYYPSRANQNRTAGADNFSVLEIPDNGADSYAFSANDMIDRFKQNIGDGTLTSPQQLTYLTHPHWFDEPEQSRVRELFSYISRFSFAHDRGPVIFTTTNKIGTLWTNGQ